MDVDQDTKDQKSVCPSLCFPTSGTMTPRLGWSRAAAVLNIKSYGNISHNLGYKVMMFDLFLLPNSCV